MYEKLGRMTGRSFEETIGLLNKGLRNAESSTRAETMFAFGKNIQEYLLLGQLGYSGSTQHQVRVLFLSQ